MPRGWLTRRLTRIWRARQAQAGLARCFETHDLRVGAVIKTGVDSSVFTGKFDGQPVVFKRYHTPDADQIVERAGIELRYLSQNLPPPFFVNHCIATAPQQGWIVLGHVPGARLSLALRRADATERAIILTLAGQWLGACIRLRSETRKLRSRRFANKLDAIRSRHLEPQDQKAVDRLLHAAKRQVACLEGVRTVFAIAHGDFAPVNLHYGDGAVHAVDIQGGYWFPAIRTAARFLVAKDLFEKPSPAGLFLGLDRPEALLFLDAAGLGELAHQGAFRFFVAEQILGRFLSSYDRDANNPHMRTRLLDLVATLEGAATTGPAP